MLKAKGYRVLEQRFPRRAYVVIRGGVAAFPEPEAADADVTDEALQRARREP